MNMDKSHQTEEWIKMLPSSSREIAGPSSLDDDLVSGRRKQCDPIKTQIGIYGWRKRCLFVLIIVLIFIVVFNLCLTLWFMEVMQFTSDGIGTLKIIKGGIVLNGRAYFMGKIVASSINSRLGKPLSFVSSHNLSISIRNIKGREVSNFILKNNSVTFSSPSFNIIGSRGETLFSANKEKIEFGTGEVRFTGMAGAIFDNSVQTPMVRGHLKRDLTIESVTRMLDVFGPTGVVLDSRAGDISVACLADLKFEAGPTGSIKLDGSKLFLPRIPIASVRNTARTDRSSNHTVYQACVCDNGRLFLSPANGECIPDKECQ